MLTQSSTEDKNPNVTTPYYIFKYSIRSELTRRYYERRIRTFFDYIRFLPNSELERRCNVFAKKAIKNNNWAVDNIIRFLQYEKGRVEIGEITAATLINFVKSIKLYCEYDLDTGQFSPSMLVTADYWLNGRLKVSESSESKFYKIFADLDLIEEKNIGDTITKLYKGSLTLNVNEFRYEVTNATLVLSEGENPSLTIQAES